jgi:subtilisin family serine protease
MRLLHTIYFVFCSLFIFSQTAPNKYWVKLKDKNNNNYTISNPSEFLSQRALDRRTKYSISIEENDLPVTQAYVDSIEQIGANVILKSKWFNAVTIETTSNIILQNIANLSFVDYIEMFSKTTNVENKIPQEKLTNDIYDYGSAYNQINIHNGQVLHNMGYSGQGMYIAVIDAGFSGIDTVSEYAHLFSEGRIIATKDFVDGITDVFHSHTHGSMVFSTIATKNEGEMVGTAPEASFVLLRSEDGGSEYRIEEDNWISAAEFADSIGIDVINSSLGYNTFDNPAQDYTYSNMDGKTSRVSIGADICSSKGIAVVISAGNEGSSSWHYITTPGDAASVLTVGAVNTNGNIASFSSRGPSADSRIKPDVVAVGEGSIIITSGGSLSSGSGTSFSAPIMAGLVTCLLQKYPTLTNTDLFNIIKESSSQYSNPDNDYGYGIPNFSLASIIDLEVGNSGVYLSSNNPFNDIIEFTIISPVDKNAKIIVSDILGRIIYNKDEEFLNIPVNKYTINNLNDMKSGIYIVSIYIMNNKYNFKLIKE